MWLILHTLQTRLRTLRWWPMTRTPSGSQSDNRASCCILPCTCPPGAHLPEESYPDALLWGFLSQQPRGWALLQSHSPKMAGVGAQTPLCKSNPLHVESFPSDLPEFCCLQAPSWRSLRVSSAFLLRQPKPFPVRIVAASPKPLPPPSFFLSQSCLLFTSVCFGFENFLTLNLTLPHLKDVDWLLLFTYTDVWEEKYNRHGWRNSKQH